MKRNVRSSSLALVMLFALTSSASAGVSDWGWAFGAYSSFQGSGTTGGFGVFPNSTDGWDVNDELAGSGAKVFCGTYHSEGLDTWTGPSGIYAFEFRQPMSRAVGASQTWRIYTWADPSLSAATMSLSWLRSRITPDWLDVKLQLLAKPDNVEGGPSLGTTWDLTTQPDGGTQLPIFRTSDGREGYVFSLTATVIPEPSSLLALLTGGAGLAAAVRRRY